MKKNRSPEEFFEGLKEWKSELEALRRIILSADLQETIKWGFPVYTFEGKNIVGLGKFKSYFGIWFFQGALLQDPGRRLINAQEGKTKAMRQLRFTSTAEIDEKLIREYIYEAIKNQLEGNEIKPVRGQTLIIPEELRGALNEDSAFRKAFDSLTPGKQREYAEYIAEAKLPATRLNRLEKITPMIFQKVGLNDKYR